MRRQLSPTVLWIEERKQCWSRSSDSLWCLDRYNYSTVPFHYFYPSHPFPRGKTSMNKSSLSGITPVGHLYKLVSDEVFLHGHMSERQTRSMQRKCRQLSHLGLPPLKSVIMRYVLSSNFTPPPFLCFCRHRASLTLQLPGMKCLFSLLYC